MAVLIGIDVGTSGTRALAVTADGELVAEATRPHELLTPRPGWTEQDPGEWWEACKGVLAEVAGAAGGDIAGLGVTGQMHGSVFLDSAGEVIRPALRVFASSSNGPRVPRSSSGAYRWSGRPGSIGSAVCWAPTLVRAR